MRQVCQSRFQFAARVFGVSIVIAVACSCVARAEDLVWTTGKVISPAGRPVSGALVAAFDDSNKVVDYARTDHEGAYALAVPKRLFHLDNHKGKGFIADVFSSVIRFAGDAAEFVADPTRAGIHAITSSEAANFADPVAKGGIVAGGVVADQALSLISPKNRHQPTLSEARKLPGSLLIKVVAPGNADLLDVGRVYWMENEIYRAGGRERETLAAWIDPVELASQDAEKPSAVKSDYLKFAGARLEPSIAEPGQSVRIVARMPLPPDPVVYAEVVARNTRTGQMWEMHATGEGRFEADIQIDKRFPKDDQTIAIIAYPAKEDHPGRRADTERAIEADGFWDVKKPYRYDPLIVVSRNRAELTLTVIAAEKHHR